VVARKGVLTGRANLFRARDIEGLEKYGRCLVCEGEDYASWGIKW